VSLRTLARFDVALGVTLLPLAALMARIALPVAPVWLRVLLVAHAVAVAALGVYLAAIGLRDLRAMGGAS
jgi:hypothetical protein